MIFFSEVETTTTDNVLDSSSLSMSNSNKSLNRSSSNPDLSPSSISNKSMSSSISTFNSTINEEDNATFVVKVYRSDQSYKYFPVLKDTTAKQLVMLAITEFSILDQSRHYSLCEISVENGVIKQKRLSDHIDNLCERLPINARYYLKNNHSTDTLVPDHLTNEFIREARIHFLQLDSLEICAQLTLRDFEIFKSIQPTEYIDHIFKLKSSYGIPHLEKFLRLPNKEMYWTITEIIRETNIMHRSKIIKHFIKIAKSCKDVKNFNSMFSVISGLDHKAVQRLQTTWERVPEKYKKIFEELKSLLDLSRNMSVYRNLLKNELIGPPIIPMFPVCMKDLTFIHLGNQTKDNGLVNFEKLRMIAKEIRYIMNMSSSPYDLSNMFDSSTSHSQFFSSFGHQSTTDSVGTMRRNQTTVRLSVMTNAKRIYDETLMVKKVKTYLNNAEIIEDEDRLLALTHPCEPVTTIKRRPSPSTSSLSSNSSCDRRGGAIQLTKFGTQSPDDVNKLLRLSNSSHQIKSRAPLKPNSNSSSSILQTTSPLINNTLTTTGLTSVNELNQHRRQHVTKIRDANKLTSESSSLNFKPPSSTFHVRSHVQFNQNNNNNNNNNNNLSKHIDSGNDSLHLKDTHNAGDRSEKLTHNTFTDEYSSNKTRNQTKSKMHYNDIPRPITIRTRMQRSKSQNEVNTNPEEPTVDYDDHGQVTAV
ncbi:unnamed protein product [Rotaria sordida]|uniref:Ras guanine nucleotide exchange factor n=1 Tax=Rotaria sordida TaxID=392033 RepID=A0A818I950_9BILA|nr:unnamed protein product [Rotaria sordida]